MLRCFKMSSRTTYSGERLSEYMEVVGLNGISLEMSRITFISYKSGTMHEDEFVP